MNKYVGQVSLLLVAASALVLAGCQTAIQARSEALEPSELRYTGVQRKSLRFAYVANAADGTVSAIDLALDQVAWTLPIGERAAHGIAASPDGNIVYAGDAAAQEMVVIDAQRQIVVKRIPLVHAVHGIDISPDGRTLWVGGSLENDPILGTLSVIDTASNIVIDVISPGLGSASHFAFTPDSREAWIASTSTNLVWIVDTATRQVTAAVPLTAPAQDQRPEPGDDWAAFLADARIIGLNEVAIAPDGRRAYAVGPTTSQLYAIDVESRQVVESVPAGRRAHGVTVSPDSQEVWIADWSGVVSVFDASSLEQLARIQVVETAGERERGVNHAAFSRDGQRVYVSGVNDVTVIDVPTRQILTRMAVGQEPHELSLEDWSAPDASIDTAAILATLGEQSDLEAGPTDNSQPQATAEVASAQLPQPEDGPLTRTSDARAVVVEVTPLNLVPDSGEDDSQTLDFQIMLDTHAVELDYDLVQIAVLRDDRGNEYRPVAWEGEQGGHHVNGLLRFANPGQILKPDLQALELELTGIAGVPSRVFRWEFAP